MPVIRLCRLQPLAFTALLGVALALACREEGEPDPCVTTCTGYDHCTPMGTGASEDGDTATGETDADADCGPGLHCEDIGQCGCEELVCVAD